MSMKQRRQTFPNLPYPQMMPWYVNSDTTLLSLAKNDARSKELQYFPRKRPHITAR